MLSLVEWFESSSADIVAEHGARLVKTIGDEVLFVAEDPVAGARLALALQRAFRRARADSVDTSDTASLPRLRVGLAYGPVLERRGDVFGTTVNRASRLTTTASAGSVVVDEALAAVLADADPAPNVDPNDPYRPEIVLRAREPIEAHGLGLLRSWWLTGT